MILNPATRYGYLIPAVGLLAVQLFREISSSSCSVSLTILLGYRSYEKKEELCLFYFPKSL